MDLFGEVSGWDVALALVVLVASVVLARIAEKTTTRLLGRLEGCLTGSAVPPAGWWSGRSS